MSKSCKYVIVCGGVASGIGKGKEMFKKFENLRNLYQLYSLYFTSIWLLRRFNKNRPLSCKLP